MRRPRPGVARGESGWGAAMIGWVGDIEEATLANDTFHSIAA